MAMRGAGPKPVELRILQGNPSKRPIPKTPKFSPLPKTPPRELGPEGKALWRRLVKEFAASGMLQTTDREQLIMLCDVWEIYTTNMAIVRERGTLTKSKSNNVDRALTTLHPAWRVARDAIREFNSIASRFGLTPSDRVRLRLDMQAPPTGHNDDDLFT